MTTITNRITRHTAGALVAAGLALGGSLGMTAVANADRGHDTHQDGRSNTRIDDRNPISTSSGLTRSAQEKAANLQSPDYPLSHLDSEGIMD